MLSNSMPFDQITPSKYSIRNKNVNASNVFPGYSSDGQGKHLHVERVGCLNILPGALSLIFSCSLRTPSA